MAKSIKKKTIGKPKRNKRNQKKRINLIRANQQLLKSLGAI